MKKTYLLIVVLCLSLFVFVGCGAKDAEEPEVQTPSTSIEESTAANNQSDINEATMESVLEKAEDINELSYTMHMITSQGSTEAKVWLKGGKMKTEVDAGGELFITIVDTEKSEAYIYMPQQNMVMEIPLNEADQHGFDTPLDIQETIDPELLEVGEKDVYEGLEVRKVTRKDFEGNYTMWISEKYGIPVKVEASMNGEEFVIEYKNIEIDNVSDSEFLLPEGIEIMKLY